ncbi:MAG TPA: right-handed parallel beta-helix repeat-containing protein [bacterium]|jgi:parallel beta-helix repeat protein|nr:right-handed parallel beta-helix repeat-containing protein [bacterium]
MKYILSFFTGLFLLAGFQTAQGAGPTYVKDSTIAASTEWTRDNSPYILQNDVVISRGAILTIDPGVEVQFAASDTTKQGAGPNLVVQGGLRAVGSPTTPISFNPSVQGSLWGAIYFYNSDSANSILQSCMIKGGRVVCNGSSPIITQSALYGARSGVEVGANSQPQIIGNRITADSYGINLLSDTASPIVTGNEIYNNNYGFYLKDFGTPNISGNRIYNNIKFNMVNSSAKSLSAPNNDFRILDAQQIVRTIYDGAYNASLGRINFMPYVGMPSGQTQQAIASAQPATTNQEKPKIQEEDFWSYGRPFDAMKISNVDDQKKKPSNTIKVLAVGATAVVTVVLLFL